jgi:ATP-dependent exoDNAse (exonuclease V) beta subunit
MPSSHAKTSRAPALKLDGLKPSSSAAQLSNTLELLRRLHAEIADQPLFTAVGRIVNEISLRQRLGALPLDEFGDLDSELDTLLEAAADAEAHGARAEEFAELLRANFATEQEASAPRPGLIQLITCQKAKGLEWDAVIVPFFSRRIHTADEDFPRVISASEKAEASVVFNQGHVPADIKQALKKSQKHEMERLLYVALTRARHTLVLASDRELFAKATGTAPSASMTTWFRSDHGQMNEAHISRLQTTATVCPKTQAAQSPKAKPEPHAQPWPPASEALMEKARARASEFPRRLLPSGLATTDPAIATGVERWQEAETEFRAATLPSAATRYGVWWHEFVQRIPWHADPARWDEVFRVESLNSPDKTRSDREWEMLRRKIAKVSDFVPAFVNRLSIARAEMPFLWAINERRCLEGVIDLAVFEPLDKKWFLLDWKTNEITPDKLDKLRAHYRPQLAAYWKAVNQLTNASADVAIYSTSTGNLIVYDKDELVKEWNRLSELPPASLAAVMASDHDKPTTLAQLEFADFP